jgi:hypothetical protein
LAVRRELFTGKIDMNQKSSCLALFSLAVFLIPTSVGLGAATVNFQGYFYNGFGQPAFGDRAIIGTFAPTFAPSMIACTYGDFVCNVGTNYYEKAVADGNILPIGEPAIVQANGFFIGSGQTDAPAGTKIYLFGLPQSGGLESALATSTDPSYLVPDMGGTTNIDAALANRFTWHGNVPYANGIRYGILPFPEPTSAILALVAFAPLLGLRRR